MSPFGMMSKTRKILCVEIGSGYYKLACFRKDKDERAKLIDAAMDHGEEISESRAGEAVKAFVEKNKLAGAEVCSIIPTQFGIFKNIEIPSVEEKEIQQIIELQSGTHTPYPKEEMVLDYMKVGTYKGRYTKELLVITKRDIVTRRYDLMKGLGLRADKAFLAAEGMTRLLAWKKLSSGEGPVGFVHVDLHSTDFAIIEDGKPIYIRSIAAGGMDVEQNRGENCPLFLDELKRSMESYEANSISERPDKFYFTGAYGPVEGLLDEAGDVLNTELEALPYGELIEPSEDIKKLINESPGLSLLSVTAPFLFDQEPKLSLIPEDVKGRQHIVEKSKDITKIGFLSVVALIIFCALFVTDIFFKSMYLDRLKDSYEEENREVEYLDRMSSKAHRIKLFLEDKGRTLDVLDKLYEAIPIQVYLDRIVYEDDTLTITGTADSMSRIFSMVTAIENGPAFRNVRVDFTRSRRARGTEVADFGLTMEMDEENTYD